MSTELAKLDRQQVKQLVATCPPEKRSALSKALSAASKYARAVGLGFERAFPLAAEDVVNMWHLGNELRRLKEAGMLSQGSGMQKRYNQGDNVISLSDLGVSLMQSQRCQRLAEWSKEELDEWLEKRRDKGEYPTLSGGSSSARATKTRSDKTADVRKVLEEVRPGDFREALSDVYAINAIVTDPPYGKQHLQLWYDLGVFARERLTDGGILVAYSGQLFLPEVYAALSESLRHWWTLAVVHEGNGNLTPLGHPVRKVINGWKPIVAFIQKDSMSEFEVFRDLVPSVKPDKHNHNWAQPVQEAAWLIETFTTKGDLVVDPMAGSGTVGIACQMTDRRFIGAEIEHGQQDAEPEGLSEQGHIQAEAQTA